MTYDVNSRYTFFTYPTTDTTEIYTLSLHDALPIFGGGTTGLAPGQSGKFTFNKVPEGQYDVYVYTDTDADDLAYNISDSHNTDRKSTRLNSSHDSTSYAVFAMKTNPAGPRDTGSYV